MRVITGSAESLAAGYDPYINNPYDPLHRLFNYPLIWHVVLKSGINLHWTNPLAVICIALFFLGLALFPGKLTYPAIILLLLITFSPAVMLGVERGNVDLVFFFLISIALILVEISNLAALLLLLLGVLFKLYPVFSLGLFLDVKKKDYLKYILLVIAFAGLYLTLMFSDMVIIFRNTPKDDFLSYGVTALSTHLFNLYHFRYITISTILYLFSGVLVLLSLYFGIRNDIGRFSSHLRNLRSFWAGAGIYIGTFLLGNNYDYRLMFLLFTIPQLVEWSVQKNYNLRWAHIALVTSILSSWYSVILGFFSGSLPNGDSVVFYLNQLINWILFVALSYLFIASLPSWMFSHVGWKKIPPFDAV